MNSMPDIHEHPFKIEVTDLTLNNTEYLYKKTEKEAKDTLKSYNEENHFCSIWDRLNQELLLTTHVEIH